MKTTARQAGIKAGAGLPAKSSAAWRKTRAQMVRAAGRVAPKPGEKRGWIPLSGPKPFIRRVCRVADHFDLTPETLCQAAIWFKLPRERRAA